MQICNLEKKLPFGAFNVYYQVFFFSGTAEFRNIRLRANYPENALMFLRRLHKWNNSEVFFF